MGQAAVLDSVEADDAKEAVARHRIFGGTR
jgi:hypothetical protein